MHKLLKKMGIITVSVDEMIGIQALERATQTSGRDYEKRSNFNQNLPF